MSEPVAELVKCHVCGQPAACIGQYDNMTEPLPACSRCCGHCGEDGECWPIPPFTPQQFIAELEAAMNHCNRWNHVKQSAAVEVAMYALKVLLAQSAEASGEASQKGGGA